MTENSASTESDRVEDRSDPSEATDRPAGRRRRRATQWVLGLLLALLLIALAGLATVLGTQSGLRVTINLTQRLAPNVLTVGQVDGRVLGRLRLTDLVVRLPTTEVRIGELDLDWSPSSIFSREVAVARLAVRDIDIVLAPTPDKEKAPLVLPDIVLPLSFEVGEAMVDRLRIFEQGATEPFFVLDHAALSARLKGSELQLLSAEARLETPRLTANAQGHVNLASSYPLVLDLAWELGLPATARLTGEGQASGDLQRLGVLYRLRGAVDADLDVHVQDVLKRPSWDGLLTILRVDLPAFRADLPQVATSARLETRGNLDEATVTGTLDAKAPDLPDFGHLAAVLNLAWKDRILTVHSLEMTEQVSDADVRVEGKLDLSAEPGRFDVKGAWERLRWPLSGDLVARSPQGSLTASGSFEDFVYALTAEALGPSFPSAKVALKGQGNAKATRLESLALDTLDGRLEGEGDLAWSPAPTWALKLRGKDLNPGVFVKGLDDRVVLSLDTKGGPDAFDYDLAATTSGPGLPPASLSLAGKGDLKRTELERLRLDLMDGRIEGQASLDLAPRLGWDAKLAMTGINPGTYAPEWPGRIDGRLTSQGVLDAAGPKLTALIEELKGTLRGYPIAAAGKVVMEGKTTRIEGLTASSGPSKARVEGRIDEALDLAFDLDSSNLASLLPDAKGRLSVTGKVQGPLAAPRIKLDLQAKEVALAGNGIADLTGAADLDLAANGRFSARLKGKTLTAGDMRWDTADLGGEGTRADHKLSVVLTGKPLAVKLAAAGGLKAGGGYSGRLATLNLNSTDFGAWSLQRPVPLTLEQSRIAAGPLCLRQAKGSGGCLEFDQSQAGKWNAAVDLDRLDFALLKGLLPATMTADGAGRIKGRFQADGGTLVGNATAEIPQGRLRLDLGKGKREELDFSNTRLTLDAGAKGLSARLGLPLKDLGQIEGDVSLPGWRLDAPARPGQALQGRLQGELKNLARVSHMVPDITGLSGGVDADLALGGTLAKPGVTGQVRVRDVNFQVPLIALAVKDVNISANAPALGQLDIRGQASLGGGKLELTGAGRMAGDGMTAKLRIAGDNLKVADTKAYFARVSPNIDVDLTSKGAAVRGEIRIPEARIRPKSVPAGTVSPSGDVVLREKDPQPPFPVSIDLRVLLGDEVTIDAFGVRGRLSGGLSVLQAPGKDMLGDGQLQITDGEYRLSGGFGIAAELGPPLKITQGRLIYAKSPIENPGLLLQAEREGGDTTAGVRVLGTLRTPKMAFFSESDPGMTQAEITKYLVTGIPPSANDKTDKAGLAVGTYVAPKVYMEYESGLGNKANKVKLRYDLSKHIELQTESGESQGADVFFKFEN